METFTTPPAVHVPNSSDEHSPTRVPLDEIGDSVVDADSTVVRPGDFDSEATRSFAESDLPATEPMVPDVSGELGLRFGDYDLLEEIARGGMGVVHRARQRSLNRIVALKTIRGGQLSGPEAVQRFRAEAEAAARLDHPGIVPVHDVGEFAGHHFYSMGYVPGTSLAGLLADGPLAAREAASLTRTVAEAMQYAHEQGVVHRDLKPGNVLVDERGRPRVTDFGLAKLHEEQDSGLTRSGQVLGTPSYMPPEQALGRIDEIGPHSDVYAIGALLYAELTGAPPFRAASATETLRQVVEEEPVPPRRLNPAVPRDLETICLKALQKSPAARYESAGEVAADLGRFLAGEPIVARPVGWAESTWRWVKRRPARAGMLAASLVALLALVAVGVGLSYQQELRTTNESLSTANADLRESKANLESARDALQATNSQLETARDDLAAANGRLEASLANEAHVLYLRRVSLALLAWDDGQTERARRLLAACPSDHRDWEWFYADQLVNAERLVLRGHDGIAQAVAISPDGRIVASGGYDRTIRLWDATTGETLRVFDDHEQPVTGLAFTPNGLRLASTSTDKTCRIRDVADGGNVRILQATKPCGNCRFSADGTRLLVWGGNSKSGELGLWDVASGEKVRDFGDFPGPLYDADLSPDGTLVASGCCVGEVRLWNVDDGERRELPAGGTRGRIGSVVFSDDGTRLRFANSRGVHEIDLATNELVTRIESDRLLSFTVDAEDRVVAARETEVVSLWSLDSGRVVQELSGHEERVVAHCLGPGGVIGTAGWDGTVRLWEPRTLQTEVPTIGEGNVWHVTVAPDGSFVLYWERDVGARRWDLETGEVRTLVEQPPGAEGRITITPDGRTFVVSGRGGLVARDTTTGEERWRVKGRFGGSSVTADGERIVASKSEENTEGSILFVNPADGTVVRRIDGPDPFLTDIALSPDGRSIATVGLSHAGRRGTAALIDAETGELKYRLEGHTDNVFGLAWSPDGTRLATSGADRVVRLWNPETGEETAQFAGHTSIIGSIAFHPDGNRLAAGCWEGGVRIWEISTGEEVTTLARDVGILDVAFSPAPGDHRLVTSGGSVRLWDGGRGEGPDR